MIWSIAKFEFANQLTRPANYVYFGVLVALAALWTVGTAGGIASVDMNMGGEAGNSPFMLSFIIGGLHYFGIVIVAAVAGHCMCKDHLYSIHPLILSAPVSNRDLVIGRFIGVNAILLFIFLGAGSGCWIGSHWPTVDPDFIVPNRPIAYLYPYLVVVIPNSLVISALFFVIASLKRSMLWVYLAALLLFILQAFAASIANQSGSSLAMALLDPFGQVPIQYATRYLSIEEKNLQLIPLTSQLLLNRAVWLMIGAAAVGVLILRLRKNSVVESARELGTSTDSSTKQVATLREFVDARYSWLRLWQMVASEIKWIVCRAPFVAVLFAVFLFIINAARFLESAYGTSIHPVTGMMATLGQDRFDIVVLAILTIWAGQLVWRDRDAGTTQLVDVLPLPSSYFFASKLISLMFVCVLIYGAVMAACMVYQAARGYYQFEFSVYAMSNSIHLFKAWLLAVLVLVIHTLANNKYFGHFLVLSIYLGLTNLPQIGLEHHLFRYSSHPGYVYSDMNGFGDDLKPILWFNLYWLSLAVMLVVVGSLFWVRGFDRGMRFRMQQAKRGLSTAAVAVITVAMLMFAGSGGYVYYNTNVLNQLRNAEMWDEQRANYEIQLGDFRELPQPRIRAVDIQVDIFPQTRELSIAGRFVLENATSSSIDQVLVTIPPNVELKGLTLGAKDITKQVFADVGVYQAELNEPMQPGDKLELKFQYHFARTGFTNRRNDWPIVENGSYFDVGHFPQIGYIPKLELLNNETRGEFGLPSKPRVAAVDNADARMNNLFRADADWVEFTATISTSDDQIAIAPGKLVEQWNENGRSFFRYQSEAPMQCFFSILSARFEVARDQWRDVDIEIYHHPNHDFNLQTMTAAVVASLEYYAENFGEYQFKHLRIVEHPRYWPSAKAFPGTIPFSESAGFIADIDGGNDDVNYPFYITAHEIAHQWWGHQVVGGNTAGAFMLTESLAQYAALMVMKHHFSDAVVEKILQWERDHYLRQRARSSKELPLALDDARGFVHYQKGALAFFALQDYLGEAVVNQVLSEFIADHRFQGPPYPNSVELVKRFRDAAPNDRKTIVEDLFERVILFDNRAISATQSPQEDLKFRVELKVTSEKLQFDESGNPTSIDFDDLIDIGIFGSDGKMIYLGKHAIHRGENVIVVEVDKPASRVGIDPKLVLIDRNADDNTIRVTER